MPISFQCAMCEHYDFGGVCEAFPEGIPKKILTGKHDHTEPYKGDKGIRYKPIKIMKGVVK